MTRVFLGLGANLGDREQTLREALRTIGERCRIVAVSSLYESPALVPEGDPPGPEFLNAAIEIDTGMPPHDLLAFIKQIEHALGRRPSKRWAARPIDIDILLYGDDIIETPDLAIPHPAMHQRDFVLTPLAEIAPELIHPKLRRTIADLRSPHSSQHLTQLNDATWTRAAREPKT